MKDKILSVLKSCKGPAGYYGITPKAHWILLEPLLDFPADFEKSCYDCILELEKENKIYLTRSTQENNRGEITLICYRDHE